MLLFPEIHVYVCDDGHVHGNLTMVEPDEDGSVENAEAAEVAKTFDTVEQALSEILKFINSHNAKHR